MVLSAVDVERFIADGLVVVRQAFPRGVAVESRALLSKLLDIPETFADGSGDVPYDAIARRLTADGMPTKTNDQPMLHLQHAFTDGPFARVMNPRLSAALDQLTGGRGFVHGYVGWWSILFPGFPGPGGWHVDRVSRHHLTCHERGVVTLFLFSDVGPGDGGTPVFRGSHALVARRLAGAGADGLTTEELNSNLPIPDPHQIVEVIGEAGDVALFHPFLIHGLGPNTGSRVRFACTPQYPLTAPMDLDRVDGAYSPVEKAIRRALRSKGDHGG